MASSTSHQPPIFIDAPTLLSLLPHSSLISHLRTSLPSLPSSLQTPPRQSIPLNSNNTNNNTLLLMPSWSSSPSLPYLGIKLLTLFPLHSPSIHAAYNLFSSSTGSFLASLDATLLTLLRTSSVSALASSFLSNPTSSILVMVGAGALSPHLIAAHRVTRPTLTRIIIWNRTPVKAYALAQRLTEEETAGTGVIFEHAVDLDEVIGLGDIVSCATGSSDPVVSGGRLKKGAHLDLVGSFRPDMRECDEEAMRRGRVFVDFEAAVEEAGELVVAMERGVMGREDVVGSLEELVGGKKVGRRGEDEVTVFKSVGTAVVDLLAAQLAYETYLKGIQKSPQVEQR